MALAVLALSCLAPGAASAASHARAPDPSPQKAPAVAPSSSPTPDPAPQAAAKSERSHSAPRSTTSSRVTTAIAPRIVHRAAPVLRSPSSTFAHVSAVSRHKPHHSAAVSHGRHLRPTVAEPVPLAFFATGLPRLVLGPFQAGAADHGDGVLLLLSALAMGMLAVSSFALLRRLKRLEGRT